MSVQKTDRKPSKDHAFEKKREEHFANVTAIESQISKLRQRVSMISDEVRSLTASDTQLAAREELRSQIEVLRAKKDQLISQKNPVFQRLQDSQASFRRKMDDLQAAKEKLPFKRVEDVDKLIADYDAQVTSGQLKLIEEKRIVAEMSKLRKARKQIESFNGDSSMVDLKKNIDSLRTSMNEKDGEIKSIQEQLNSLHDQLGKMSSSRSAAQGKIKSLLGEKAQLSKSMNGLYEDKNKLFESFNEAKKAHNNWFQHQRLVNEESHIQRDIDYQVRKLEQEINDLSIPVNSSKIQDVTTLQAYLKHNVLKETSSKQSQSAPVSSRQVESVDDSLVMKTKFNREEETYMNFGSKSKKSTPKKTLEPVVQSDTFKLPVWILADFESLGIKNVPLTGTKDEILKLIDSLESVKSDLLKDQAQKASTIDSQKQSLESNIASLKARNVHEEAVKAVKEKEDQRKDDQRKNPSSVPSSSIAQGAPGLTVLG